MFLVTNQARHVFVVKPHLSPIFPSSSTLHSVSYEKGDEKKSITNGILFVGWLVRAAQKSIETSGLGRFLARTCET